jgi:diguanylate cyclase (GGDEF)-like protein
VSGVPAEGGADGFDAVFAELRREYLQEAPARIAELRKDADAFRAGEPDAAASLVTRFHRLAGSGGSYGFDDIGGIARAAERWLAGPPKPTAADAGELDRRVAALARAVDAALADVMPPAEPAEAREFSWLARLVVPAGSLRNELAAALEGAGYRVESDDGARAPEEVTPSERPDLVVISAEPAAGDPYAMAAAWTGTRFPRPRAVALLELGRGIDRLRAITAGVDAIFGMEQIARELPRYARTLSRLGAPPQSVLLIEGNPAQAASLADELERASIRVLRAESAAAAQDFLDREVPDLILVDAALADIDGLAFARYLRQDPRFHLVPIVFLTSAATVRDHIEALRAGADDFLTLPADPHLLLQVVISRAERGRRIREMVHRDGLTGLLNHATLMAELEHAVEYARRNGETFAFLVFDLDHFRRVNERFGHLVGDQVLFHVAALLRGNVRASDLIGRYGGEEFAMILRGCARSGAELVAGKLQRLIGDTPAETTDGSVVPVHASAGCACFLTDGVTAAEIAHAAERALHRAKSRGRGRVEFGE